MTVGDYAGLPMGAALALAKERGERAEIIRSAQPRGADENGEDRVVRAALEGGVVTLTVCRFEVNPL